MKFFLLIIFSLIISSLSLKNKLCINCKYFVNDKFDNEYGKCTKFPIIRYDPFIEDYNYILDISLNGMLNKDYFYCKTARKFDDMCGKNGTYYRKKYVRKVK